MGQNVCSSQEHLKVVFDLEAQTVLLLSLACLIINYAPQVWSNLDSMVDYFTLSVFLYSSKFKVIYLDVLEETRKAKQSDSNVTTMSEQQLTSRPIVCWNLCPNVKYVLKRFFSNLSRNMMIPSVAKQG